jgi:hypothetical protein
MSKFASLTAGLLARKGEAEPTSTPFAEQLLTRVGAPASDIRALTPMHPTHNHAEPGAPVKQQGFKAPPPAPALPDSMTSIFGSFGKRSVQEMARAEQEPAKLALVALASPDEEEPLDSHCGTCPGPASDDAGKTYHVNLRLKRQRFIKLKLSAALLRRPVQDVVSEALDQWFDRLPGDVMGDCACLKARGD